MKDHLVTLLKANCPIIIIRSVEEQRMLRTVYAAIDEVSKASSTRAERTKLLWDISTGIRKVEVTADGEQFSAGRYDSNATKEPVRAINEFINSDSSEEVMIMLDAHPYVSKRGEVANPMFVRQLRNASYRIQKDRKNVIMIVPYLDIPLDIENNIYIIDPAMPTRADIKALLTDLLDGFNEQLKRADIPLVIYDDEEVDSMSDALVGLTEDQIENVASVCFISQGKFDRGFFRKEKAEVLKRSSNLEFATPQEGIESMGGLAGFKDWLQERSMVMSDRAREFGVKPNLSMLTVGPPGTGKSLSSRISSNFWGVPMIRFNLGDLMNKFVGESEERLRTALRIVESAAPCLLEIDEIEKSFAQSNEDGVGRRMLGKFLTWFQELDKPVFINATANDVTSVPPELINRFETVMYFPLPNQEERRHIWQIKLRELGRDPVRFDLETLSKESKDYTGRDIVKCLNNALYIALNEDSEDVTTKHIIKAMENINPINRIEPDKMAALTKWAKGRAVNASKREENVETTSNKRTLNLPAGSAMLN